MLRHSAFTAAVLFAATAFSATLTLKADAPDALIVGDAPRTVTVTVTPAAGESGTAKLNQVFIDRYGQRTQGKPIDVPLGKVWTHKVDVPVEYFGPATYQAELVLNGKTLASDEQMLIRPVPLPTLTAEQRLKSPIGINTHHDAHWDTLGAMGIHWARDYSWGWLGYAKALPMSQNQMNFSGKVEAADKAGITILPILQKAYRDPKDEKFFTPDTDAITAAYQRLSAHWPQIPYWELDNEADLAHRDREGDDFKRWTQTYLKYIPAADKGLTQAGHGAKVVLNGEAGIHVEFNQMLLDKVGDHFAVINYHSYAGTIAPELAVNDINTGSESTQQTVSLLDRMRLINQLAHDHGKEAWLTEIAWSARRGPAVGDRLQSAYLHRIYLLAEWAGTDKTFWFWDRDLPGGGRFSSTGLIDQAEENKGGNPKGALPAGAAMAAVSKFIATAEYAGSIDLGVDQWCLAFKNAEGGYTLAAWAVHKEHDIPGELADADAFGMYGNPLKDRKITAEPAYFMLQSLPDAWNKQLEVEWQSPRLVNIRPGSSTPIRVNLPDGAHVVWTDMPGTVSAGEWSAGKATLTAKPELQAGDYHVQAAVEADGWTKRFPLTLKVRPAINVSADSYSAGKAATVTLTNEIEKPVTVSLASELGKIEPASVTLAPGKSETVTFTAGADESAPANLTMSLDNGGKQTAYVRPKDLAVPHAGDITLDGDLSDWPANGELTAHHLGVKGPVQDFSPTMKFAWSDKGLYVAARIPVGAGYASPSDPQSFWEWTSVELNMHAAPAGSADAEKMRHLLFFVPVQEAGDNWRVFAGEWLKPMPQGEPKTINDDDRMKTATRYDGQDLWVEVLIPTDVLGATPMAGEHWPLTISSKLAAALSPRTVAAWPAGTQSGPAGWGRLRFQE